LVKAKITQNSYLFLNRAAVFLKYVTVRFAAFKNLWTGGDYEKCENCTYVLFLYEQVNPILIIREAVYL
jgi:hypothetical protein